MADTPEDDDLLKDLMGAMGDTPQVQNARESDKSAKLEVNLDEATPNALITKASFKNNVIQFLKKLKSNWQLLFMVFAILASLLVWLYLPQTIDEEEKIHEPAWWVERGMYYYKIAEDKGLEVNYLTGEFSRYEFDDISFNEQKEIFEDLKLISGFHSNPNLNLPNQFLVTFINDLNKLLLDDKLIEKIPKVLINRVNKKAIADIKDNFIKSGKASENVVSSVITNQLKILNRELLEICFEKLPKNKPVRKIAAKYFKYIYDKYPYSIKSSSALDLLRIADTFYYVLGDSFSKKDKRQLFLMASNRSDTRLDFDDELKGGGYGVLLAQNSTLADTSLSLEDNTYLDYMIASLSYELNDFELAEKFYKKFLDLALEKSSEGLEERKEKDLHSYASEKISVLHREITPSKIYDAYFKLGKMQFLNGETDEARNNLEEYIYKSTTSEPEKFFYANETLGDMYMKSKNFDKALTYFKKSLGINSITHDQKNPIRYKIGLAYYQLADYPNAIERFKQVSGSGENGVYDAAALFYSGKAYLYQKNEEEAIDEFKRIRERFSGTDEDMAGSFEIAKYNFRKGLYDIAYSEPMETNRGKSQYNFSIKTLLEYPIERFLKNEYLDLNEILKRPDSDTQEIGLLYGLANIFTANKNYAKVIDIYTLMMTNPLVIHQMGVRRDKLYFDMAKIWAENGAPIRAGETLESMLEKVPDSPLYSQALWEACKYYMIKNDYGRAIKPLRKFSNMYYGRPESSEASYLLGICEQKVGNFDYAIEAYNKAYGYLPWSSKSEDKKNIIGGISLEDPYYALDRLENPIDRNFFAYQAIFQKGDAYRDVGRYDEAIEHIYRTVFNDPLFRFKPASEIWQKSLLIYADCFFNKGIQENKDLRQKSFFYQVAEKNYKDYLERYKFTLLEGLGEEFTKLQKLHWEEDNMIRLEINYRLAYIKFEQQNYAQARSYYDKIVKWPSDQWVFNKSDERKKEAFMMLPLTYYKENNWSEAILAYRNAKDHYATSLEAPILGMRIAECLQNLGDYSNAKMEYDASKWALELANTNLYDKKPESVSKQYWDELLKLKKENLDWVQKNNNNEKAN